MDKRAQLIAALKALHAKPLSQVFRAVVKSVQGLTCTVDILGTDLEDISEVRLRADEEAKEGFLITPATGSLVLVGMIDNDMGDLYVCQFSQVDKVEYFVDDAENPTRLLIEKANLSVQMGSQKLIMSQTGLDYKRDKVTIKATEEELNLTHDKASLKADSSGLSIGMGKSSLKLTDGGVNISSGGSQVVMQGGLVSVGNPDSQMKDILLAIVGVLNVLTVEVPNLPPPNMGGPPFVMSTRLNTASTLAIEALNQLVIKLMA